VYYYRVTAAASDESVVSNETNAKPALWAWSAPTSFNPDSGSPANSYSRLDFNKNGYGVVAWVQDNANAVQSVFVSLYNPQVGWGAAMEFGPTTKEVLDVGIDDQDNVFVIWAHYDAGIVYVNSTRYTPSGGWTATTNINTEAPYKAVNSISLEVLANGTAFLGWKSGYSYWVKRYDLLTGWGSGLNVTEGIGQTMSLAASDNGDAIVVWTNLLLDTYPYVYAVKYKRYAAGSGWGSTGSLASINYPEGYMGSQIAMDKKGNAVAYWNHVDSTGKYSVWFNKLSASTGWESPQPLVDSARASAIALNDFDNVAIAWIKGSSSQQELQVMLYKPSVGWGAAETIATNSMMYTSLAVQPKGMLIDDYGNVTIAWLENITNMWGSHYISNKGWTNKTVINQSRLSSTNYELAAKPDGNVAYSYIGQTGAYVGQSGLFESLQTAEAGPDQAAYVDTIVSLDGSASSGFISSYSWRYFMSREVDIGLTSTNQSVASLKVPKMQSGIDLLFLMTTTSSQGALSTDIKKVSVLDSDSDNDGLHDQWELNNFGNLTYDGGMDSDLDGVNNYHEYTQGSDPTLATIPPAPPFVNAVGSDGQVQLTFSSVEGASSYNLYWGNTPGVNRANGNMIAGINSTFSHTGLTSGGTYYYVVTTVNLEGESIESVETSATASSKSWSTTGLELNDANASEPNVAVSDNGSAMVIWQQKNGSVDNTWYNQYVPISGWGGGVTLTNTIGSKHIKMDQWGNTLVTINPNFIKTWYFNGSVWAEETLRSSFYYKNALDMNSKGDALISGTQSNTALTSFGFSDENWLKHPIDNDEQEFWVGSSQVDSPSLAIDEKGNAILVWSRLSGSRTDIWASRFSTLKYYWSTPVLIENTDLGNAEKPQVKIDSHGNATVVWHQSDGSVNSIWSNRYINGSGWETAQLVEADAEESSNPQLGVDINGNVVVVWEKGSPVTSFETNRFSISSGWGVSETIPFDVGTSGPNSPVLAVLLIGDAWLTYTATNGGYTYVRANTFTPASGWGAMQTLNSNGNSNSNPDIAVNAKGEAFLVYEEWDGVRNNIISQVRK